MQHRDIQPKNILFDESGHPKLVDFGTSVISKKKRPTRQEKGVCGRLFAAPEILMEKKHNPVRSDIWALGVTILWMVRGELPWKGMNSQMTIRAITSIDYYIPKTIDQDLQTLLKCMLAVSAKQREFPTDEQLARLGVSDGPSEPSPEKIRVDMRRDRRPIVPFVGMAGRVKTMKAGGLKMGVSMRMIPRVCGAKEAAATQLPALKASPAKEVEQKDWDAFKQELTVGSPVQDERERRKSRDTVVRIQVESRQIVMNPSPDLVRQARRCSLQSPTIGEGNEDM